MKILVNNEERDVGDKPMTLVSHDGAATIRAVDDTTAIIDPAFTAWVAERLVAHGEWPALRDAEPFRRLWALVWGDVPPPADLGAANYGMKYVVGLIVALSGVARANKHAIVRLPETGLHPKQQLGLADLMMQFIQREGK